MDMNEIISCEKTVVRIHFDEKYQKINEMEFLKIVSENKKTLQLSNGVTVAKVCLFPYHKQNHHRGEEYFFLDNIKF